ncbi:hypothetical protein Nepgr_012422 [Nepenthes gracilis]|uniref:Uncharacterized protein n=1 Tax=Nepenthes gracilis TaxID=150966 RepID=A0AAD3SGY0_NEPGR|nr:hypothetical protein Nepgr_012422 [Nepenthes gracilis]
MDTSHVSRGIDAFDSTGQGNSLVGDWEGLMRGLVIPQRTISRNAEQQLDHSCNQLHCCCRPALGSDHGEVTVEREAPTLVVADQAGFYGTIIDAI